MRILSFLCCGSRTRTSDLWVMSPTSYQLLHPAMFSVAKVRPFAEYARYKMLKMESPTNAEYDVRDK